MEIYLKKIEYIIKLDQIHAHDILAFFVYVRTVMENENANSEYPVVKLYCDWLMHSNIDRSKVTVEILEKLSVMLLDYDSKKIYTDKVTELISIFELRKQLIKFLETRNIDFTRLLNDRYWKNFYTIFVVNHLINKPIKLPHKNKSNQSKDKNNDIYNQILKRVNNKKDCVVKEFSFVIDNNILHWQVITSSEYIRILGQLQV